MDFWNVGRVVRHIIGPSMTTVLVAAASDSLPDAGGIPWHSVGPTGAICAFCGWLLTKTIPEMQKHQSAALQAQELSHGEQFKTIRDEWRETRQDIRAHVERVITALEGVGK